MANATCVAVDFDFAAPNCKSKRTVVAPKAKAVCGSKPKPSSDGKQQYKHGHLAEKRAMEHPTIVAVQPMFNMTFAGHVDDEPAANHETMNAHESKRKLGSGKQPKGACLCFGKPR